MKIDTNNSFKALEKNDTCVNQEEYNACKQLSINLKNIRDGVHPPLLMNKIGFWNINGLNRAIKQSEMQLFIHYTKVGLFGVVKTKLRGLKLL